MIVFGHFGDPKNGPRSRMVMNGKPTSALVSFLPLFNIIFSHEKSNQKVPSHVTNGPNGKDLVIFLEKNCEKSDFLTEKCQGGRSSFKPSWLTRYTVHGRGAKSPLGSEYRLKTRSKKFKLFFKKVFKNGPKSGSKPVRFPTVIHKVACFWTVFSKTFICGLSNLHCSVPCVTRTYPQYRNSRKSVTDTHTNGTSSFWLSHERKGASRNYPWVMYKPNSVNTRALLLIVIGI